MPYAGKQLMPRKIAQWGAPHWKGNELVKMVSTGLGESAGFVGAWHDNFDDAGKYLSRDCGLMQINVSVKGIDDGTAAKLMTDSLDPLVYGPVIHNNVQAAYNLYEQPGPNNGLRRWQPWVAYTTGWATFPEWWVWHQDADHNPVGPWLATGRYVHRAIAGVANYHLVISKNWTESQALEYARNYAEYFKVTQGTLAIKSGIVAWTNLPAKPTDPPADGVGLRPQTNSGA